jgi:polyferredoxin
MFKKVGAFYKRTYTAAFPTYEERHGYRGVERRKATFTESVKWAALFAITALVSLFVAMTLLVTVSAVFGPIGIAVIVFLAIAFGVVLLVSRIA